jgi:YebC/PmpR family DNA-binding regulatory protein
MAGHSKWANIKHRKAIQDSRRSKVWTRILREVTIAARQGGAEPENNPSLRLAIQNAKGANIPKETLERAIKKGSGGEAENLEPITYECYGPVGVGMYIEATTDNLNRTLGNIRALLNKHGGTLATKGSLNFVFSQKGVFRFAAPGMEPDEFEMELIDAGADEITRGETSWEVQTPLEQFGAMLHFLEQKTVPIGEANLQRIPLIFKKLTLEEAKQALRLIERLEDDDDINEVYHNLELTEELEAALNADV